MPFSQKNPFNADANFTSIKFGVNKPVLEVELNEMQSILRNHSKDSIKEIFGNGVIGKGTYTYSTNTFTLANEVVILDGEVIKVDSVSVTANNGDTIYLHSWIELKSFEDTIKKYGNSASATTVTNTIKDARVNMETSRREQLLFNIATTLDGSKNSLKLGRIVNNTFVLDCNVLNQNNFELVQQGSYITVDNTKDGVINDIEVLGNTVQDSSNLADIKSVGVAREDGNYEIVLKSCGKNLFNKETAIQDSYIVHSTGVVQGGNSMYCASDFIPVKPNTKYYKTDATAHYCYFDKDKKVIPPSENIGTNILTTPGNAYFMRITVHKATINAHQLEEGTVATSYEPYKESTSKIILPCPLEKVGDVSDKLFRREDGVWCIEKNIANNDWSVIPKQTSVEIGQFDADDTTGKYNVFRVYVDNSKYNTSNCILTPFTKLGGTFSDFNSYDGECCWVSATFIYFKITKNKTTLDKFKLGTAFDFKVKAYTPQIIELPLEQQISLNSFFGTTNVFIESGEVEGTIKCTIPKSLGASLQSINSKADSLQQRVEKIENLQKGNEMVVSTNKKSVVVEDTNEGYVTDFNIKGDTLVNLLDGVTNVSSSQIHCIIRDKFLFRGDKKYTIINLNSKPITVGFYKYSDFTYNSQQIIQGNSCIVVQDTLNYPRNVIGNFSDGWTSSDKLNVLILEGDHTDKDISYFEGLKSVGDGVDKIELITSNSPFFNKNKITQGRGIDQNLGVLIDRPNGFVSDFIRITEEGLDIKLDSKITSITRVAYFDKYKNCLGSGLYYNENSQKEVSVPYKSNAYYIRFEGDISYLDNIEIKSKNYLEYNTKHQTKELLYKNTDGVWEKPVLRKVSDSVYDSIELHSDGKYYYHKRCGEVVLNGSESGWTTAGWTQVNSNAYYLPRTLYSNSKSSLAICDKFPCVAEGTIGSTDTSNICGTTQTAFISFRVAKSYTLDTFKTWLSQNLTTVVYELATEEVFECTDLSLNAYDDTTFISLDSGFINPAYSCKVSKHIGNVVNQIKEKTDKLEEKVGKLLDERTKGYSSNKGYVVAEDTTDSYIENVKIEGNTLVNLAKDSLRERIVNFNSWNEGLHLYNIQDKKYTLFANVKSNTLTGKLKFKLNGSSSIYIETPSVGFTGIFTKVLNLTQDINYITLLDDTSSSGSATVSQVMVLEGDHTNNPPSYFEGLLSTGQDVEVMELESNTNNFITDLVTGYAVGGSVGNTLDSSTNTTYNYIKATAIQGKMYYKSKGTQYFVYYTDENLKVLKIQQTDLSNLNNDVGAKYIITNIANTLTLKDVLITENKDLTLGTVEHKEDTKQLLYKNSEGEFVPIPALRRINDSVKDTIELHNDGKYYYHKRCDELVLKGDETWSEGVKTSTKTRWFYTPFSKGIGNSNNVIWVADKLPCDYSVNLLAKYNLDLDFNAISFNGASNFEIVVSQSKLATQDVTGFKTWLSQNPTTVVYQLATEEVYECNYLDLNSYEGETLVQIDSGVISPSKLSFTTNSDLPNLVDRMKEDVDKNTKFREEMTESVTLTREFENGYEVFEDTREGSVSIDSIEGNTLVNLVDYTNNLANVGSSTCNFSKNNGYYKFEVTKEGSIFSSIKTTTDISNKEVTLIIDNKSSYSPSLYKKNGFTPLKIDIPTGINIIKINTDNLSEGVGLGSLSSRSIGTILEYSVIILEGDHTQNPPSYFEGLKSVGDTSDKIEVLSQNRNLFKEEYLKSRLKDDGYYYFSTTGNTSSMFFFGFYETTTGASIGGSLTPNKSVDLSNYNLDNVNVVIGINGNSKDDKTLIPLKNLTSLKRINNIYVSAEVTQVDANNYKVKNPIINFGTVKKEYVPLQQNKKQILFKNSSGVYEKPVLRSTGTVLDTIEKHSDGKYYFHKRCGEVVFDGSSDENWLNPATYTDTMKFALTGITYAKGSVNEKTVISDRFLTSIDNTSYDNKEGICGRGGNTGFNIQILKTKLSSQNVTGFKTWLSQNPTTVVYQLATEEVYECVNLDLDSYEGETSIILPSTIPAKIKASVGSNLLATIESLKDRIAYLETEFSDMTENGSGWCKLPNGMIMQWLNFKRTFASSEQVYVDVPYPIALSTVYHGTLNVYGADTNTNVSSVFCDIGEFKKTLVTTRVSNPNTKEVRVVIQGIVIGGI